MAQEYEASKAGYNAADASASVDGSGILAVGPEEFLKLRVKDITAFGRFIFMDEIVAPIDACEEEVPVGFGKSFREIHEEGACKTLPVTRRRLLSRLQDEDPVDVRCVLNEKLEVPLAGADQFRVVCECRRSDGKPTLRFRKDMEQLVQLGRDKDIIHGSGKRLVEEFGCQGKHFFIVEIVLPGPDLEFPEFLGISGDEASVTGHLVPEERRIRREIGDIDIVFRSAELRGERAPEVGTLIRM